MEGNIYQKSEYIENILNSKLNVVLRWGIVTIAVVLVMIGSLVWFIKWPDTVESPVVLNGNKPVVLTLDGTIDHLYVQNGQQVKKGQALYTYNKTAGAENLKSLQEIITNEIALSKQANGRSTSQQYLQKLLAELHRQEAGQTISSPVDGSIVFAKDHLDELAQGDELLYIIPEEKNMGAEVLISQADFSKVKAGQEVKIKLESYPFGQYGFVPAEVASVSGLPLKGSYCIHLRFPQGLVTTNNHHIAYKYGLTGTAEIVVEKRRLIEKLLADSRNTSPVKIMDEE